MNIVPGFITYLPNTQPGGWPPLYVRVEWQLQPNKEYTLQLTGNAIDFTDVFTFTSAPGQGNFSHTANPVTGPWPRLVQK